VGGVGDVDGVDCLVGDKVTARDVTAGGGDDADTLGAGDGQEEDGTLVALLMAPPRPILSLASQPTSSSLTSRTSRRSSTSPVLKYLTKNRRYLK
jgi:hypothetical protein